MKHSENRLSRVADYLARSQNVEEDCLSDVCGTTSGIVCPPGLLCVDLWRHGECRYVD